MNKHRHVSRWLTAALALLSGLTASAAMAGRGSSPAAISRAITSGSVEAIESELERAEVLVCPGCVRLVAPLVDHDEARVRRVAAWWLVRRGMRSELFVDMALRLAQPDSRLARNAADVLGEMRSYKAIKPLGAALANTVFDPEARAAMAHALGEIGDLEGLAPLTQALAAREPGVRAAALAAMRDLRGFAHPGLALAGLDDGDADVRVEAIYTIAATRGRGLRAGEATPIVQALARLVTSDRDERVRKKAAWALGEIGAPASLAQPALSQAAGKDESPLVRSLASAALTRLAP